MSQPRKRWDDTEKYTDLPKINKNTMRKSTKKNPQEYINMLSKRNQLLKKIDEENLKKDKNLRKREEGFKNYYSGANRTKQGVNMLKSEQILGDQSKRKKWNLDDSIRILADNGQVIYLKPPNREEELDESFSDDFEPDEEEEVEVEDFVEKPCVSEEENNPIAATSPKHEDISAADLTTDNELLDKIVNAKNQTKTIIELIMDLDDKKQTRLLKLLENAENSDLLASFSSKKSN